ncbi:MAG: DNA polymerase I [Candidatus Entotheonellia bacterium]
MAKIPRLFLIDGSALAYRSYFAFIRNPLINSKGENTSAVFGYTRTLLDLLTQEKPEYIAVAFDTPEPTFRHERFVDYKATRQKMPDEMSAQWPRLKEVTEALGVTLIETPGFEADDVMGTLAKQAERGGLDTYLVTADKDLMQLVSPHVKIYSLRKVDNQQEILDRAGVQQKFGVPPERVIDVLALMGDSSDNIPGIRGIGEKTAVKLIQEYGDLETVLAKAAEIKPKGVADKILANVEMARLSQELATIHIDVPLPCSPTDLAPRPRDAARLTSLFQDLEFGSLVKQVADHGQADHQGYQLMRSRAQFDGLCDTLATLARFAIDTETTDLNPLEAELLCVSVAWAPGEAYCMPLQFPEQGQADDGDYVLKSLKPILESPAIFKCGQNIKYDMLVLSRHGVELQGVEFDTMVASYVVNPSGRQHNLDALALEYLHIKKIPITDLIGSGKGQRTMREVPLEAMARYACEDADVTWRLRDLLEAKLTETATWDLFQRVEIPLITVLKEMEQAGVRLDVPLLRHMSQEMDRQLLTLTQEIYELAGERFNINSTQQLGRLLFEKLEIQKAQGIKRVRRTKTGYSTDVAALEQFKEHPLVGKMLEYRQLAKLKSTYVDALPQLVNPHTGRVHTSYNQTVAATGRLSSSDPNLQNIPARTELGREIRKAFIAETDDRRLLSADYSQIELRILAHLAQDATLIESFRLGEDVHRRTASKIFGVPPEQVTPVQRARAKTINFGVIYGMGPMRLAREIDISLEEAKRFIEAYFATYPGVHQYTVESVDKARERGYATTLLGRRRYLPELFSDNQGMRVAAEYMAVNTPVQGSSADLIKLAMINIRNRLRREQLSAQMLLQVHDELVFEVPLAELDAVKPLVVEEMERAVQLDVPIKADVGAGRNWFEAH